MSLYRVVIRPGKRPHFMVSVTCFDKDALIQSNSDPVIIETKMTEKELQSLTSVKAVYPLSPPVVLSSGLSVERLVLDIFSIPKNNKIVKLKDLDSGIFQDIIYKYEFHTGTQHCLLEKSRMARTDLESFFNDAMTKQGTSTQNEIKLIFFDADTDEYYKVLSNKTDADYLYLEFRKSETFRFT